MGLITCLYFLTGMTKSNWAWFLSWLLLGIIFYFLYGYKKSKLALAAAAIREVETRDAPVPSGSPVPKGNLGRIFLKRRIRFHKVVLIIM